MAKFAPPELKPTAPPRPVAIAPTVEVLTTVRRRIGPGQFEVVAGVVRGVFVPAKLLERSVSLAVSRLSAEKSLEEQHRKTLAALRLSVES